MFLTVVHGIFTDWKHPRHIVHLTSTDMRIWGRAHTLKLANEKVIDAAVTRMPDGVWRMWHNNEQDRKSIYYADSTDLSHWADRGHAVADQGGEGPKVFQWKGAWWMITDVWHGLAVSGDRACLFYFTHPGRRGPDAKRDGVEQRRSSIQVTELFHQDGKLGVERDLPTRIVLRND